MTNLDAAMVAVQLEEIRDNTAPCCLCGAACRNPGIWVPTETLSKEFGAPEGKTRVIVYALCSYCHNKKDSTRLIEETLTRKIKEIQCRTTPNTRDTSL